MNGREALIAADHQRARELAAARVDGLLAPSEEAWLAGHLEGCASCAAVAAEYDAQHDLFGALRGATPQPPRDLWARTAAVIDAERRHARFGRWRRLRGSPGRSTRLPVAPVVAMLTVVVVVVVGAGLLNSRFAGPGGTVAAATPIAIKGAADLQVLSLDSAGNLQLLSRRVDEVCPTGVTECGVSPTFAVTAVSAFGSATDLLGAISPSGGQMVVVRRDPGSQGVYVVPVKQPAASRTSTPSTAQAATASQPTTSPTSTGEPSSASASPSPSFSPASATPASPIVSSPSPSASPGASPTATPSDGSATPSTSPSDGLTPPPSDGSATASPPGGSGPAFASGSPALTAVPSVEASPAPDTAIKIASGVTVVGAPVYSPGGSRLAFAAMPFDGSSGPDIYLWSVGDAAAQVITSDHGSWLAGWTDQGILVSRVDDGVPTTYSVDPATGLATAIGTSGTWLPSVSPTGTAAAWWSGTVKLAADGVTWVPDRGQLVLGAWPSTDAAPEATHVLARGHLGAWQVRWDDTGTVLAVWEGQGNGQSGRLTLYSVDATTGAPDLANPMLDATAANPDFSLRAGRLAWTTPDQSGPQTVEVLAWSGKTVYPTMELPADGSGPVVP
ncbi:MAG: zf-HC2 domain-containing protein [Candidatus Limnocylindrales bacterium]